MRYYTTARISDNIHETPEGFLLCVGVPIARVGQMIYMDGETPLESGEDGRVLIEREEHEVFRPETIASFEGKAVTIAHPSEPVTPANWCMLAKGIIQNVRRGTGENSTDLIADLLITDETAIKRVKSGLREVSCGYDADYIQTEPGRGIQTKIVGNHVALVDEGRAGPAYAINDAKGKGTVTTKISDKVKTILARAQQDIGALMGTGNTDDGAGKTGKSGLTGDKAGKDAKEDEPTKDAEGGEGNTLADVVAMVKALSQKVDGLIKGKTVQDDDNQTRTDDDDTEEPGNSDDGDIMDRLDKLEKAVAKLLEAKSNEDDTDVDEEAEEFSDGKNDGGGTGSEDAMPKNTYTGDTASRMEILAPGKRFQGKDAKMQALKAAYATADGKKVIDQLTGKRGLTMDGAGAGQIHMLFISAAELLKQTRQDELAGTKRGRVEDSTGDDSGPMTPERINQINAEYYGKR